MRPWAHFAERSMNPMSLNQQKLMDLAATLDDDGDAAMLRHIANFIGRLDALARFLDDTVQELRQPQTRSLN
jgi:hypothetical protein